MLGRSSRVPHLLVSLGVLLIALSCFLPASASERVESVSASGQVTELTAPGCDQQSQGQVYSHRSALFYCGHGDKLWPLATPSKRDKRLMGRTAPAPSCASGGVSVSLGSDLNSNGELDLLEVTVVQTLCETSARTSELEADRQQARSTPERYLARLEQR